MEVPDASIILNRPQIWDLADAGDDGKLDLGLLLSPQTSFGNIIHEHADEEVVFFVFFWMFIGILYIYNIQNSLMIYRCYFFGCVVSFYEATRSTSKCLEAFNHHHTFHRCQRRILIILQVVEKENDSFWKTERCLLSEYLP